MAREDRRRQHSVSDWRREPDSHRPLVVVVDGPLGTSHAAGGRKPGEAIAGQFPAEDGELERNRMCTHE